MATVKKFLIIGSLNAVTYKEVFPLIKDNQIWLGCSLNATKCSFLVDNGFKEVNNAVWYTNMDNYKRHIPLKLTRAYNHTDYQRYDNYNAINVDKVANIPVDYEGVIGVPITFLTKYCSEQFDIVKFRKGDDNKDLSVNGKCPYFRILIKRNDK